MKEKPILVDADVVRSIIERGKTQHREPINKYMTIRNTNDVQYYLDGVLDSNGRFFRYPYGQKGDRIWVREPFRVSSIQYKADGDTHAPQYTVGGWQPSMYMPRWASRLTMDIEEAYIQSLQSMSDVDAMQEGSDIFEFPAIWNKRYKETDLSWAGNPLVWVTKFRVI